MVRYRLSVSFVSTLLVVVAVAAAIVLSGLVSAASRSLGWAVACSIVALLLSPVVGVLERGLPHALAVIATLILAIVVLGGAWVGMAATLADNAGQLSDDAPAAAADLEDRYEIAADFELERRVRSFTDDLDERFGTEAEVRRAAGTGPTYVVTGMLMLFLLIYGRRFIDGGLALIDDEDRRARAREVLDRTTRSGVEYLLVALAEVIVVSLLSWLVFALLGLQAPFALGLFLGLLSLVPHLGMLLGGLPALLLAAGLEGTVVTVPVLLFVVALQLVDSLVVRHRVDPRTVHVGPALPLIVGLLGWTVYGLGGALYGVALLVLLLAFAQAVSTDDASPEVPSAAEAGSGD